MRVEGGLDDMDAFFPSVLSVCLPLRLVSSRGGYGSSPGTVHGLLSAVASPVVGARTLGAGSSMGL